MRLLKTFFSAAGCAVLSLALAACGGGATSHPPVAAYYPYSPDLATYVNTASIYYLPVKAGNTWTFSTGGKFVDAGPTTITCSCAINGSAAEAIHLVTSAGVQSGTFYFSKTTSSQTGGVLTDLVGSSTNDGQTITLITNGTGTYGLPVMDDRAFLGEAWTYAGAETSTITAIDGTQQYAGAYVLIRSVNSDSFTGDLTLKWSFAQGVGPTSLTYDGASATLVSFSIDAVNSQSIARQTRSIGRNRSQSPEQALALLKTLF